MFLGFRILWSEANVRFEEKADQSEARKRDRNRGRLFLRPEGGVTIVRKIKGSLESGELDGK